MSEKLDLTKLPQYSTYMRIAMIMPIIGIFIGIMNLVKPTIEEKKLGEHLIAVSILCGIAWFIVLSIIF
jgi:hypothetical protein